MLIKPSSKISPKLDNSRLIISGNPSPLMSVNITNVLLYDAFISTPPSILRCHPFIASPLNKYSTSS